MQRASGFGRRGRIIGPTRSFQADEVLLRLEDALALGTAPEERDAEGGGEEVEVLLSRACLGDKAGLAYAAAIRRLAEQEGTE